ncbi:MAG: sulfotransferase family 2 domain-containing protein [Elainellaceae cyanobacterium]
MNPQNDLLLNHDSHLDNQALIFLHLMKTGGRTLVHILKQNYDRDVRFHCSQKEGETLQDLQALSEDQRRSLQLFYGHIEFGLHQTLPQPSTYVTLLRHPVERVVSHYYYGFFTEKHYTHDLVNTQNISLPDYMAYGMTELDNGQTRRIAGSISDRVPFGKCTTELLEIAKQNLDEKFLLAGLTERFDEFLLILGRSLGLHQILYTRSNVNTKKPTSKAITAADRESVLKYNQLDLELYTYATQKFDQLIERLGQPFQSELELFQTSNQQYQDLQATLDRSRQQLQRVRKRRHKARHNRDMIQAQISDIQRTVDGAIASPYGQLWKQWSRLKSTLKK